MYSFSILIGLSIASALCWIAFITKPQRLFNLLAKAADRQFIKNPVGDFGLMVLIFVGIITLFGLVNIERQFRKQTLSDSQTAYPSETPDSSSKTTPEVDRQTNPEDKSNQPAETSAPKKPSTEIQSDRDKETTSSEPKNENQAGDKSNPKTQPESEKVAISKAELRTNRVNYSYLWQILCCLLLVGFGRFLYNMPIFKVGFGPLADRNYLGTLQVGIVAFIAIVPPILLLHAGLTTFLKQPYEHSTLNVFQVMIEHDRWDLIVLTFCQTAIGAALVEEFLFRGVIQGFAERVLRWSQNVNAILLGPLSEKMALNFRIHPATLETNDPTYQKKVRRPPMSSGTFWTPIVVSSITFALIHVGQGAAPISLYVLAMALGFVYKVTGNLSVCIIVHFLLNGLTLMLNLMK